MRRKTVVRLGWVVDCCLVAGVAAAQAAEPPRAQASGAIGAASPRFAAGGPDSDAYGAALGDPVAAIFRQRFFVGLFSHLDRIRQARPIARAAVPLPLKRAPAEPVIAYRFDGRTLTLDDYLARNPATGLLIARGDTILAERHQYGRTDTQRLASFSIAKTFTSMLIGIARFRLLLAHRGRSGPRQVMPAAWIEADTTVAAADPHLQLVWAEAGLG